MCSLNEIDNLPGPLTGSLCQLVRGNSTRGGTVVLTGGIELCLREYAHV